MKIWITGCAGFLGTHLAKHFASPETTVVGFSRRECSAATHSVAVDLAQKNSIEILRKAIELYGTPDVVIHAASRQPGTGTLVDFAKANVGTTVNLLDALKNSPPRQLIYTSTLSVYSQASTLPVTETYPPSAGTPYAATKRWAEEVVGMFKKAQVTVLRLPSLYGAGQADSFIDGLARLALRGDPIELFSRGELIREALHVSDITKAISLCIAQPPKRQFCVMNIGCGRPITTLEFGQALVEALASKSKLVPSERETTQRDLWADISLARELIGFNPTELRESMKIYANELRT